MLRNVDNLHRNHDYSKHEYLHEEGVSFLDNYTTESGEEESIVDITADNSLRLGCPTKFMFGFPCCCATWRHVKAAIYISFIINVVLLLFKFYAAFASQSLTVIASALDSLFDLLSGIIIFATSWFIGRASKQVYQYPGGTSRIEPLGIIIFATAMFTATLILISKSVETLAGGADAAEIDLSPLTQAIIASTVILKLILFIYCRSVKGSESVQTLAADHRNDVISNIFGLAMAFAAFYWQWYLDAAGAILVSFYIMFIWFQTGYEQVKQLSGVSADPQFLTQLTYLAWNHHPEIVAIDTVRAYHMAYNYLVEMDIVLPEDMPLKKAHDIGESLQDKIESIDSVERAWVHLDYEYDHSPEHKYQTQVREFRKGEQEKREKKKLKKQKSNPDVPIEETVDHGDKAPTDTKATLVSFNEDDSDATTDDTEQTESPKKNRKKTSTAQKKKKKSKKKLPSNKRQG
eukprot:TRINITY_DN893_c0_g1_i3.p1 TRINITY_DN893_c0_g1~~TRINITY_DN893_c0_g1_i3.p1  ORF type:complete len:461 (+),score=61.06 TRINITY_DN893_c0_g1_i3:297-1679(+)